MNDRTVIPDLIEEAREVGSFLGPVNGGTLLLDMADALEALNREKENLSVRFRNQMDAATELIRQLERAEVEVVRLNREDEGRTTSTDWGIDYSHELPLPVFPGISKATDEELARLWHERHPGSRLISREVFYGPWVEVSSDAQ